MELRVRVIEARNLPSMDTFGKSDPYCTLRVGQSALQKTAVIDNTNSPSWGANFRFDVVSYGTDILVLQMYDKDVAKDDKMGKLNIQVYQLPPGLVRDVWYPLTPTKGCAKPGEIRLQLQVALKGAPEGRDAPFRPYNVRVRVVEARGLAKMDTIGKSDPYCLLNLVGAPAVFRTTVKKNTLEPRWGEETEFVITHPVNDILHVLVRDEDIAADDDMATLDVALAKFANLQPEDAWYQLKPVKGVKQGGEIRLCIQIIEAPPQAYSTDAPGSLGKLKKKKK
jgi:Ca2+-dependent lipid-binding protein